MKYSRLILANLFRKKIRLGLTLFSFFTALLLFGFLAAVKTAFNQGVDVAGVDRLVVINRVSLIQPVPISYSDRIQQIKGVKYVTHSNWFGGIYQDPKNFFPQFAIDVDTHRKVFPEFVVPDDQWQNFVKDRQGAIVGAKLAKRFGFKVGDRVPIQGTIVPGTWEFNIDGIYKGKDDNQDETQFWFQWEYYKERIPERWKGLVGWYTVRVDNPDDSGRIAKAIDEQFANSSFETKTDTEKAFATGFAKQIGNIGALILIIGSVVFFTLLLVTGNTMATSVRERTAEVAVLKAVGYSDLLVLWFVIAESLTIAVVGGGAGLLGAVVFAKLLASSGSLASVLPNIAIPRSSLATGAFLAFAVGIASGLLPAVGAMRLRVVEAMRRV
jgi:putative ABC transport system permease protein